MAKKKVGHGIHAPQKCGGTFLCEWTDENLPYLICDKCSHKMEDWIKWEKEYKDLWQNDDLWKEPKHFVTVILGYFNHLYSEAYKVPFHFSYTENGLFRGSEAVMIRRLLSTFQNNPSEVKSYLDWFFKTKVVGQNKKLSSLSPLTVQQVIGLFRHQQAAAKKITRSTAVSDKMIAWIVKNSPSVLEMAQLVDFGDLQQFLNFIKQNPNKQTSEIKIFVDELYRRKLIDQNLSLQGLE